MGELREIKAGGDKWADGVPEKARVVLENVLGECDRLIIVGIRRDTGATTGMRSFVVSREAPKTSKASMPDGDQRGRPSRPSASITRTHRLGTARHPGNAR